MTEIKPFVPPDVDLRDFPCLPIDIVRLFASEFHARSSDAEWRAGLTLWLKSFHQVPAASLPDDDVALARLAEFGRDQASWLDVKTGALRNWTRCADGRLYHRTVAIKALEAWVGKLCQRRSGAIGNAKRWKVEADLKEVDNAYAAAIAALTTLDPRSNALSRHRPVTAPSQTEVASDPDPDCNPIPTPSQPDRDPDRDPDRGRIAREGKVREGNSISNEIERVPARDASQAHNDDQVVVELRPKSTKAKKTKRAETEWPADLELTDDLRQFAEVRGYRGRQVDDLWQAFHNRALAKAVTNADWKAAWRTWVLQQVKFDGQSRNAGNASARGRPPDV